MHFSPLQFVKGRLKLLPDAVPMLLVQSTCSCDKLRKGSLVTLDHPYASLSSENCKIHGSRHSPSAPSHPNLSGILSENCRLVQRLHDLQNIAAVKEKEGKENSAPFRKKFKVEDIKKGLQLRFACGSSGYRKVIELNGSHSPLPSIRKLQSATEHIKFAPGILEEVMAPLHSKFKGFTDSRDRDINIVFDEMVTKQQVDYDPSLKRFIGYGTMPGQENEFAEKGEIYVFRGIHKRFKQTVCYHLNPKETATEEKKKVILELLKKAKDMDANVVALVCDMGNRGLLSALGFSTQKASLKWCVQNPVDPLSKLWCVPDPVHLFKSMKESLCSNKFIELPQRIVAEYSLPSSFVSIEHIQWLDKFQSDDTLQLVPGLTFKDLKATHFSKMKVRSSLKVVHPRTAAALTYLVVKGIVPEEFETTAWFLKLMNRWFQLMTSRNLQCAFGHKNMKVYDEALEHLKLVIFVFKFIKIPGGWKPVQSHVIFATNAILEIQDYLLHKKSYQFVQTAAFTSEVVENINSCVRITNPNPIPLEFKTRLKHVTIAQFQMKIATSSYDYDGSQDYIDLLLDPTDTSATSAVVEVDISVLKWTSVVPTCHKSHQDDVLYRMSGYVVTSLKRRRMLSCDACFEKLRHSGEAPHPNGLFLILTDFIPGAQFPVVDEVFQLFRVIEYNLMNWLPKIKHAERLDNLIKSIVQPGTEHFKLPSCHNVKEKLADAFTVMRFRQLAISDLSPSEKNSSSSLSSKTAGSNYLAQNYRSAPKKPSSTTPKRNPKCSMKRVLDLP